MRTTKKLIYEEVARRLYLTMAHESLDASRGNPVADLVVIRDGETHVHAFSHSWLDGHLVDHTPAAHAIWICEQYEYSDVPEAFNAERLEMALTHVRKAFHEMHDRATMLSAQLHEVQLTKDRLLSSIERIQQEQKTGSPPRARRRSAV